MLSRAALVLLAALLLIAGAQAQPSQNGDQYTWTIGPNAISVRAGNISTVSPAFYSSWWGDTVNLSMIPVIAAVWTSIKTINGGDAVQFSSSGVNVTVYQQGTDGMEWNATFRSRPNNAQLKFALITNGITWNYQDDLYKELGLPFADNGTIYGCNQTFCNDGKVVHQRPVNVLSSYAGYGSISGDFSQRGGLNYATAKAIHILRPKIIDSTGQNWTWATMNITGITLTVSWPAAWNISSVPPYYLDPDFGYSTKGGSYDYSTGAGTILSGKYSAPTTGTVAWLNAWIEYYNGAQNYKMGLWDNSGKFIAIGSQNTTTSACAYPGGFCTNISSFSTPPSVTSGLNYYLGVLEQDTYVFIAYDSGGSSNTSANNYASPTDFSSTATGTDKLSIWATYTGGASAPVCSFTQSATAGQRNTSVTLTDSSSNSPTTVIAYGIGTNKCFSNITMSSLASYTFFPSTWGMCQYQLYVSNSGGSDAKNGNYYVINPWVG